MINYLNLVDFSGGTKILFILQLHVLLTDGSVFV